MQFENTSMNSSLENSLMSPLLEYDELLLNALPRTFGGATTTDYPFYLATFLSAANESSLLGEEGTPLLAEDGAGHAGRDFALDFLNLSESGGSVTKIVVHNVTRKILNASSNLNFQNNVIVPLYAVIFLLSVIGNSLVILTLAQNKRMRTVTNVYLLNLAVSDLLLGVFCMPFTLVGQILRNFIFGKIMCKLIPYFQAVSVSVAVWTLVAISLERYFAICRPLSSRRWQTQFHAYKMIGLVWLLSFLSNSPLLFVQQLQPLRGDTAKCREVWPSNSTERTYVIFLDIALLVLPLVSMVLAYSLIVSKLWRGLRREMRHSSCQKFQAVKSSSLNNENGTLMLPNSDTATCSTLNAQLNSHKNRVIHTATPMSKNGSNTNNGKHRKKSIMKKTKTNAAGGNKPRTEVVKFWLFKEFVQVRPDATKGPVSPLNSRSHHFKTQSQVRLNRDTSDCESNHSGGSKEDVQMVEEQNYKFSRHAIRSTYMDKSIEAKKKVIRMLFVIIVEFFVCWAPIHILNTVYLYSPSFVYTNVSSNGIALVQLMAYISSCCNPITYCFMNRRFRQSFLGIFNCYKWRMYCCCSTKDETVIPHTFGLKHGNYQMGAPCNSDASGNDSTVFAGRGGTRSEIVVLEAEDRV